MVEILFSNVIDNYFIPKERVSFVWFIYAYELSRELIKHLRLFRDRPETHPRTVPKTKHSTICMRIF